MNHYIVFAGVNGAGKSTAYRLHPGLRNDGRVNTDEIIRNFGGNWKSIDDQFKAGRIALTKIEEYFETKVSFSQETTLASRGAIKNARRAKDLGYFTELHYVGVESAEISIDRIKKRVDFGGHGIEDDVVRKRYTKSLRNLKEAISQFDIVYLYDNTIRFRVFAVYYRGELVEKLREVPGWYLEALW